MPANLTPDYVRAEERFRQAASDAEKLEALQEMLRTVPKHKGTEKIQADIKRRMRELRRAAGAAGPGRGPDPFHIPKTGAGQVVLIGPPNVGKSLLLARTTKAPVKVADYPFTTALPVPGMAQFEDVQIELVDTPPVTADHLSGGLMNLVRQADVVGLVIDLSADALEQAEMVRNLLAARGISLRTLAADQLPADDPGRRCGLLVANKTDLASAATVAALRELYGDELEVQPTSAMTGEGLDRLIARLWQLLAVIRVYTKQPGKPPDHQRPFILDTGSTVEDLARQIHQDLPRRMKYARLWGHARFDGQQVHRTETLRDKDVVEIHE